MKMPASTAIVFATAALTMRLAACAGATTALSTQPAISPTPSSTSSARSAPTTDPQIHVASGFASNTIAAVPGAREVVGLPNGDLLVGTSSDQLYIVPGAEGAGSVGSPSVFITLP